MKSQLAAFVVMAAVSGLAVAQSEEGASARSYSSAQRATTHSAYKCMTKDGSVEYTNIPRKGCKVVDTYVSTVPAPKRPVASTHAKREGASANGHASPNGFPKVDSQTQKSRDGDRKQILQDELRAEQEKLAKQKADYKGGEPERQGDEKNYAKYQERVAKMKEDIERSEKNIEALTREIANLK